MARRERGRHRRRDRVEEGPRGRRRDRRPGAGAGASGCRISGFVKFGSVDTIGGATLAGFDLPTAQALFDKEGKLDQIRVAGKDGRHAGRARGRHRDGPPAGNAGAHRRGAGRRGRRGHERVHLLPPLLPARVRGHRPVRRCLRDRQLALDHDRPAHARARDAADARRIPAPGADAGRRRGARDGHRSRRSSASSSGSRSRPGCSSSSRRSDSRCRTAGSCSRLGRWSWRSGSESSSR